MILAKNIYQSTKVIPLGSTAFRQPFADSHCKFLHGYRLQAKFWFSCNQLDNNNWVVDFGSLKELKKQLEDAFDHTTCVWRNDPELPIFQLLHEKKIIDLRVFDDGVGIEKFAEYCHNIADSYVRNSTDGRCWCEKVEVWEHEGNSAIFEKVILTSTTETIAITPETTPILPTETVQDNPTFVSKNLTSPMATKTETNNVPPLYGKKVINTFKDPFAGTSWGNNNRR